MKKIKTKNNFPQVLREAGYKATPARLALLKLLQGSKEPLSIGEIMEKLKGAAIDQATVYRILTVLESIGVVRQINLRHGHADYEYVDPKDHHHIICINCNKVEDFIGCNTDKLATLALGQAKNFSKITQHSLEFFGICKSCAAK